MNTPDLTKYPYTIYTPEQVHEMHMSRPPEINNISRWLLEKNGQTFRFIENEEVGELLKQGFILETVTLKDWIDQVLTLRSRQGWIHFLGSVPEELWADEVYKYYELLDGEMKFAMVENGRFLKFKKRLKRFIELIFEEPPLPIAAGAHQGHACNLAAQIFKKDVVEARCLELLPFQSYYVATVLARVGTMKSLVAMRELHDTLEDKDDKRNLRKSIERLEKKLISTSGKLIE